MLDLAPSGFRDGEQAYDGEELEGVENIVYRDLKNTEVNIYYNDVIAICVHMLLIIEIKGVV